MNNSRKKNSRYIFYRYYCPIVIIGWLLTMVVYPPLGFVIIPFLIHAGWLISSVLIYKFSYRAFGELERATLPPSIPLVGKSFAYGRVRWFYQVGMRWDIYREGIGLDTYWYGEGFIPVQYIERTERLISRRMQVWHGSPEIRSPLIMPSSLMEPLAAIMAENNEMDPSFAAADYL